MYNSTVLKMKTFNVLHFYVELQEFFFYQVLIIAS